MHSSLSSADDQQELYSKKCDEYEKNHQWKKS